MLERVKRRFGRIQNVAAIITLMLIVSPALAQDISNAGFEEKLEGWQKLDKTGNAVKLSNESKSGTHSLKILEKGGSVQQKVTLLPNTQYEFSSDIKGAGLIGVKVGEKIFFDRFKKSRKWTKRSVFFETGDEVNGFIFASFNGKEGRFDNFALQATQEPHETSVSVVKNEKAGRSLSPDLAPGRNFDLLGWSLNLPSDDDNNGKSDKIGERELAAGYSNDDFFYTADDGGMVMIATIGGAKTSKNTKNVRTELREMLRRGNKNISTRDDSGKPNKNNWVFSHQPKSVHSLAGAVDGKLTATLSINRVTQTGKPHQMGVVVIGQIHAIHDEPIKLFYRKMPGHKRGSVYVSHEPVDSEDDFYNLLGDYADRSVDPADGIALDEVFSYDIIASGAKLRTVIRQGDKELASVVIDQSNSGYGSANDFMYFKAGVYNQNNSGDPDDYVKATFYDVKATH
jgi:poly(beta-D-mannuronate) lyase